MDGGAVPQLVVPEDGFVAPPAVPQPNIFPIEWRVENPKLDEIYERAKTQGWNPSDIRWDTIDPQQWSREQQLGIAYWFSVLANFDASGPPVFAHALVQSFEQHQEDPLRKCFFSITRDEVNHEEVCQRAVQAFIPGGPLDWEPATDLERAFHNNIGWLYHNGGRYWSGFERSFDKYPLAVVFHAVPRHGHGYEARCVPRDLQADRPRRVAPPPDLSHDPRDIVAGSHRRPQGDDHQAAARRLRVPLDGAVGTTRTVLAADAVLHEQPPRADGSRA
jgi:hypothetical protein